MEKRGPLKRVVYYTLSLLTVFGAGSLCGHTFLPRVVERTVYSEARAEGSTDAQKQQTSKSDVLAWADVDTSKTTARAYRPDGSLESEKVEERRIGPRTWHVNQAEEQQEKVRVEYKTVEVVKWKEQEPLPPPPRPNWAIAAGAGWDLSRSRPVYLGSVERRILGPVALGAWVTSSWAAGAFLRVSF